MCLKNIQINKDSDIPVYRQISHEITKIIQQEKLKSGDKLPTEREFAKELKVARGTITKALAHLAENGVIEILQGCGCFVAKKQNIFESNEKVKATQVISQTVDKLKEQNFSYTEIKTLFNLVMLERENKLKKIKIALVDCNPEALSIFFNQFNYISKGIIDLFILEEIISQTRKSRKLTEYDLIVTTKTHYLDLINCVPNLSEKVIKIEVSPSRQTIIDITSLKSSDKIGIICDSKRFQKTVLGRLESFQIKIKNITALYHEQENRIDEFLKNLNAVIMAPNYSQHCMENINEKLDFFVKHGGKIIQLNYQIDRDSLSIFEERLSALTK